MLTRAITGALFVVVLVGSIWLGPYSLGALLLVIITLGLLEFFRLTKKDGVKPQQLTGVLLGWAIFISAYLSAHFDVDSRWIAAAVPLAVLIPIAELFRKADKPFHNMAYTVLGVAYVAIPFTLINYFNAHPFGGEYSSQTILGFWFLLWTNDTGAYLVGSSMGRTKLFERISPKKTWEGSIGGFVLTLLVAWALSLFFTDLKLSNWLTIGAIVMIFGTLGDLVESMFKRSIGVKDSGTILPGHGGILDRFDGVLISAPMVFAYLMLLS